MSGSTGDMQALQSAALEVAGMDASVEACIKDLMQHIDQLPTAADREVATVAVEAYRAMAQYVASLHRAQIALCAGFGGEDLSPEGAMSAAALLSQCLVPHDLVANVAGWLNERHWCDRS